MAFKAMKIQNFPDIDLPTVVVTAVAAGRVARRSWKPKWRARSRTRSPPPRA